MLLIAAAADATLYAVCSLPQCSSCPGYSGRQPSFMPPRLVSLSADLLRRRWHVNNISDRRVIELGNSATISIRHDTNNDFMSSHHLLTDC